MKKSLLVFLWLGSVLCLQAQATSEALDTSEVANTNGPYIAFETAKYHFGTIETGEKVNYAFKFINKGTEPLLLLGVETTCGCTAPSWPKEPILPGAESEIKIVFNSTGKMGSQRKRITVRSNANNNSAFKLYLEGEITSKKAKK